MLNSKLAFTYLNISRVEYNIKIFFFYKINIMFKYSYNYFYFLKLFYSLKNKQTKKTINYSNNYKNKSTIIMKLKKITLNNTSIFKVLNSFLFLKSSLYFKLKKYKNNLLVTKINSKFNFYFDVLVYKTNLIFFKKNNTHTKQLNLINLNSKLYSKNFETIFIDKNYKSSLLLKYYNHGNKKVNFVFYTKKVKNLNLNLNFFLKYIILDKDTNKNFFKDEKLNLYFMSNNYLINNHNLLFLKNYSWENKNFINNTLNKNYKLNNYYPIIFTNEKIYSIFFKKFKYNLNLEYIMFNNKFVLNFLESFFKKKISITISNNYFNKFNNYYLRGLINNYKNLHPIFFKNYSVLDFIEVVWYSFYLKDLNILSNWISKFMEGLNFKNHKRFVLFFQNFVNKNASLFSDVLKIKGFFFDIRGKVGVTGSSKKRHFFVKFGCLGKSSKINKVDFNQNLVRSYSGVMGVTYIISY